MKKDNYYNTDDQKKGKDRQGNGFADNRKEDPPSDDAKKKYQRDQESSKRKLRESQQENILLNEFLVLKNSALNSMRKKQYLIIIVSVIAVASLVGGYSFYMTAFLGYEHRVEMEQHPRSSYIIQNQKGKTVDTWLAWNIPEDRPLYVSITGSQVSKDKLDAIEKVINSQESIEIDNKLVNKKEEGVSIYYVGWKGAAREATISRQQENDRAESESKYQIPSEFVTLEPEDNNENSKKKAAGDIVVVLREEANADGYVGLTKSVIEDHEILKSITTIYNVDELKPDEFEAIFRHEFGHALGLAHASDPQDLMHDTIQTEYPYISPCDIQALKSLYLGNHTSRVTCKD